MSVNEKKKIARLRRKKRIRNKIVSTSIDKIRLSVFKSAKHIYAQIIDDKIGNTIVSASSLEKELPEKAKNVNYNSEMKIDYLT